MEENIYNNRGQLDILKIYKNDIEQYDLLSKEEEQELLKKYKEGDKEAKERLINSNLRLVKCIASNYQVSNIILADLIQEGNIGLIEALEKYDIKKGVKFSTYATYWIKRNILMYFKNKSRTISIPVYKTEEIKKLNQTETELLRKLQREPKKIEIAQELGITLEELEQLLKDRNNINLKSLDETILLNNNETDCKTLKDFIAEPNYQEENEQVETKIIVEELLKKLNDVDREFIETRYGLNGKEEHTRIELSELTGTTRCNIGQKERRILYKDLLNSAIDMKLPDTLGMKGEFKKTKKRKRK